MEERLELDPIIDIICRSMPAGKIFPLGTYPANPAVLGYEYDLLVLINSEDKRPMHEFESLIANRCHDHAMVTASVYQISFVTQLLKKGNVFFASLCNPENILFDGDKINILRSELPEGCLDINSMIQEFNCLITKAKAFLSGAISYRITSDFQLAAFMLHQTVEHCLNAFLSPLIGHRLHTHNLNKLFIYARRFSCKFYKIFPRNTDSEIQVYQTLYKAYIYGRYKNNFQVSVSTLQILIDRATILLELTEVIFSRKMETLKSGSFKFI